MPLTPLSFKADFGDSTPLPPGQPPTNFLDVFARLLLASGLTETKPTLREEFNKHVGPNSNFNFKNELMLELQQLYKRFTAEGEYQLSPEKKAAIALKIQEGISACSAGFYNRVIVTNQSFSTPNTLAALLTKIRHAIVTAESIKAIARSSDIGYHVHIHNRFFLIASQLFGVQKVQEEDPFPGNIPDSEIVNQLQKAFNTRYQSPIYLVTELHALLRNLLEEQFYYAGRKNAGCNTPDSRRWVEYLEKIGISYDSCLLMNYPYTDDEGQACLLNSSSSPAGKSREALKAMLNQQNGLIYFNNILYYTDFSAQNDQDILQTFYEFSEDEDADTLQVKDKLLSLPLDKPAIASRQQLDELRTKTGMQAIYGRIVDLNWSKIKGNLMQLLVDGGYFRSPLTLAEQCILDLFQKDPSTINMQNYLALYENGFVRTVNDFIRFLELFDHLPEQSIAQCLLHFLELVPQKECYDALLELQAYNGHARLTAIIRARLANTLNALLSKNPNELTEAQARKFYTILVQNQQRDVAYSLLENCPLLYYLVDIKNELLLDAIRNKNQARSKALLTLGADPNYLQPNTNNSMFWLAITEGLEETVDQMLGMRLQSSILESTILDIVAQPTNLYLPYLEKILQKQANLNVNRWRYDEKDNYALHMAVLNKKPLTVLQRLCQAGADIAIENKAKKSPFDLALESGQFEAVELLINNHTPTNLTEEQLTAMCENLIKHKRRDLAFALFKRYPATRMNLKNQLLCEAIKSKDQDLINTLLDLGADPNHVKDSMLWLAITQGLDAAADKMLGMQLESNTLESIILYIMVQPTNLYLPYLEKILQKRTDLNLNRWLYDGTLNSALHMAVLNKKPLTVLKRLCQAGANIAQENKAKKSSLDLALESGQFEAVEVLINNHTYASLSKEQLIFMGQKLIKHKRRDLALALLRRYPATIMKDLTNQLLGEAIVNKDQDLINTLLDLGADPNHVKDSMLWLAITQGLDAAADKMLDMQLESNTLESIIVYIMAQPTNLYLPYLEKILQKRTDLNLNRWLYDGTLNSALHMAVLNKKPLTVLQRLCQAGADIAKENKAKKSPLDLALESGQFEAVEVLINHTPANLTKEQLRAMCQKLIKHNRGDLAMALWITMRQDDFEDEVYTKELEKGTSVYFQSAVASLSAREEKRSIFEPAVHQDTVETTAPGYRTSCTLL